MDPLDLTGLVRNCAEELFPTLDTLNDGDVALERPRNRLHGDWSSSIALKIAKQLGASPQSLAQKIAEALGKNSAVVAASVAGPGFVNITLSSESAGEILKQILELGDQFGASSELSGEVINVEFVSANPTGPLHIGHTRWAALGDSLVRVLRAAGAKVTSEFYINDWGIQMELFGESVLAATQGSPPPTDGYRGDYINDLAERVLANEPSMQDKDQSSKRAFVMEEAYRLQLGDIKNSLKRLNVNFDVWFSERTLHETGSGGHSLIEKSIGHLHSAGHVFEREGALWVRTTDFGDDKDRVIRKADGSHTYFAADAAYYLSKSDRGFLKKIYLLGADHHGYVHRLLALAEAAGDNIDANIEILIGQLVSVDGAKLSKRAGNIIELDALQSWLGTDALRYSLARYPANSPLTLDPDILTRRSNDNPVFYVQYAHARTHQVAHRAKAAGVTRDAFNPSSLTHESEAPLIATLSDFTRVVAQAATLREPHRVARHLEEIATAYHRWYDLCRVSPLGDEPITTLHQARLGLNDAVGQVLRNGLSLLGVSAPNKM